MTNRPEALSRLPKVARRTGRAKLAGVRLREISPPIRPPASKPNCWRRCLHGGSVGTLL